MGSKHTKRKHPPVSLTKFVKRDFPPEKMMNEKCFDPEDSTLRFVDREDEMDCKYSSIDYRLIIHFLNSDLYGVEFTVNWSTIITLNIFSCVS